MTQVNKSSRLRFAKYLGLLAGIGIAIYSSRESIVQIIDSAKGLAGFVSDARDAMRHTRQVSQNADAHRQQLAELTKLVREIQRQVNRRSSNECEARGSPF